MGSSSNKFLEPEETIWLARAICKALNSVVPSMLGSWRIKIKKAVIRVLMDHTKPAPWYSRWARWFK